MRTEGPACDLGRHRVGNGRGGWNHNVKIGHYGFDLTQGLLKSWKHLFNLGWATAGQDQQDRIVRTCANMGTQTLWTGVVKPGRQSRIADKGDA